jgi:hypothetical protein
MSIKTDIYIIMAHFKVKKDKYSIGVANMNMC